MVHSRNYFCSLVAVASLAACGGGSSVSNASPRISEVPAQSTTGGTAFTLDLSDYVTDREGATLTYSVTSGGGAFAGASYTNTFDTMGEYDVAFSVTDGSKTTTGTFRVRVTSANYAVVREDSQGLLLLDTATNKFVRIAGSVSTPSFAAGLSDGRVVYQVANGAGKQLWVFDPLTRRNTRVAEGASGDVTYRAKTSDDKIVYTTGTGNDLRLYFYNPVTGVSRDLAQGVLSTITVMVNSSDLVFYEVGVNGQADVFAYDPVEDEIFDVGTADTDEQIQVVLAGGGVVFSRVGAGGEHDLFHYRVGSGLVEVGLDVPAIASRFKTVRASSPSGQVVFTALNGGDEELFAWNPTNGQTATIATGVDTAVDGVAAGNEVVYRVIVSSSEHDAFFYDLDDGTNATLRNSTDRSVVTTIVDGGGTNWALIRASGDLNTQIAVSLIGSPATQNFATTGPVVPGGRLANGDFVVQRDDGTELCLFDASAGTWNSPITGTGLAFAGDGLEAGDFVYSLTASAQTDLSMWDASATASVVVSNTTGDDAFQAMTDDATILFTRIVGTNTNADLFVWNGTAETRLTEEDVPELRRDHTVLGKYSGTR